MECRVRHTIQSTQNHGQQQDIPVPKGVTPFARTASSWKHAYPGTPGMHTIELRVHNQNTHHRRTKNLHNLKYEALCFDRNSHMFVPNSM